MLSIDARLTLIALMPLPLVSVTVRYFGSAIHKRFEAIQAQLSEISAVVQEALGRRPRRPRLPPGSRTRSSASARANEEYVRAQPRADPAAGRCSIPSMTLFLGFGSLLVLWLGSREVIRGRITLGEFVAFNAYLVMLSWPMIAFGWVTNMLQRGMASWKRMLEVLDAVAGHHRRARHAGRPRRRRSPGAIEFRDLTFAYPGADRPVLDRISLRIDAGQTVALRRRDRLGQVDAAQPAAAAARSAARARCSSTASTSARSRSPRCAARSASCRRSRSCSRTRSPRTSRSASRPPRPADERPRRAACAAAAAVARLDKDVADFPEGLRHDGRRARHHAVGRPEAAHRDRARADASIPRILILDDALSAVDTYTEEEILTRLRGVMRAAHVDHRRRTASRPCATPTRSSCSTTAASPSAARHDELVAHGGLYAALLPQAAARGGAGGIVRQQPCQLELSRNGWNGRTGNVRPRRRSPRQGLRRAPDAAAAAATCGPYRRAGGAGARRDHRGARCCSWRSRT